MLKINDKKISNIKYNGSFIKQAKLNGEIIFNKIDNLLDLREINWEWNNNGGEASAIYNEDNTLSITYDGSSSFGLNIKQNNLVLTAGKTYRFSCDNIGISTWIGLDNNSALMLNSGVGSIDYTPTSDLVINQIVIWCDKNQATYNNTLWNIKLEEV